MRVEYLTYQEVRQGKVAEPAELREHSEDVDRFLSMHFDSIKNIVVKPTAPSSYFAAPAAHELFERALKGSRKSFLESATQLTNQLSSRMNGRTPNGLLVVVRVKDAGNYTRVVVLKLQVATENAAIIREIGDGRVGLEAIHDVLDSPGNIQKAVIYPGISNISQISVTEKSASIRTAGYFLDALGVSTTSRPDDAVVQLVQAVQERDEAEGTNVVAEVISMLPEIDETEPESLLAEVSGRSPGFAQMEADVRARVLNDSMPRPVVRFDATTGLKAVYVAGSITITGPAQDVERNVSVGESLTGEGWQIVVRSNERPVRKFKR